MGSARASRGSVAARADQNGIRASLRSAVPIPKVADLSPEGPATLKLIPRARQPTLTQQKTQQRMGQLTLKTSEVGCATLS